MNEKITLITDLVLKLDDSKLSEKIVSSVQEYSGQLLPLIVDIYNGKDEMCIRDSSLTLAYLFIK